jgi:hypothetical protein
LKAEKSNVELTKRINVGRKINVSGTIWEGKPAARIAASTWMINVERDLKTVTEVLAEIA